MARGLDVAITMGARIEYEGGEEFLSDMARRSVAVMRGVPTKNGSGWSLHQTWREENQEWRDDCHLLLGMLA
jgi:hypothetical protein